VIGASDGPSDGVRDPADVVGGGVLGVGFSRNAPAVLDLE